MAPAIASHFIAYVQPAEKEVKGANRQLSMHGWTFTARKYQTLLKPRPERKIFKIGSYRLL